MVEKEENEFYLGFPFPPYEIQVQFMNELKTLLSRGGFGIFESPTGTGKTLSVICAALSWLKEVRLMRENEVSAVAPPVPSESKDEPSWINDFIKAKTIKSSREMKDAQEKREKKIRKNSKRLRRFYDSEDEFLCDWTEDGEQTAPLYSSSSDSEEDIEASEPQEKIVFCSRTHSQLSQFVSEVRKTAHNDGLKLVALASRKNMCINPDVRHLSGGVLNEKCLDMLQTSAAKSDTGAKADPRVRRHVEVVSEEPSDGNAKPKRINANANTNAAAEKLKGRKKGPSRCPYMGQHKQQRQFRDAILSKVMDIEEVVAMGQRLCLCPYYAARDALPEADVLALPYNTVLHAHTRESVGLGLEKAVVIVDEAHNAVEATLTMHSSTVRRRELLQGCVQLEEYLSRFLPRLRAANRIFVQQILFVLKGLLRFLEKKDPACDSPTKKQAISKDGRSGPQPSAAPPQPHILSVNDVVCACGFSHLNLFKLHRYMQESNICRKVSRYAAAAEPEIGPPNHETMVLRSVESFLLSLMNSSTKGRVLYTPEEGGQLQYVLLDATDAFSPLLSTAHALVLAGGTMSPNEDTLRQIFGTPTPTPPPVLFSCSHVVSPDRLRALVVSAAPSGESFHFSYEKRTATNQIRNIGRTILNAGGVVPGGMVVFFPSYSYLETVAAVWRSDGMWGKLSSRKKLFLEAKGTSSIDSLLSAYTEAVKAPHSRGAILLSVVGGKISEGINFSDELGRCVVMVGVPFPNTQDPVLREKMALIGRTAGKAASETYYINLAMKAVNQCIGRAIRHSRDYAAVLLLDTRYSEHRLQSRLPHWMLPSLVRPTPPHTHLPFGTVMKTLGLFFREMGQSSS